mgnify:CR=1 FL=1
MDLDDIRFLQNYFKTQEKRDPTITEIRMIDTYWSDHCRHTTFLTELGNVTFEDADVEKALAKHPNVVIAVSEGIRFADGTFVGEDKSGAVDVFGHKQLSGAAKTVASAIKAKFGCKTRGIELNTVQRCASHIASLTDLTESVCIGKEAVKAAIKDYYDKNGIEYDKKMFCDGDCCHCHAHRGCICAFCVYRNGLPEYIQAIQ